MKIAIFGLGYVGLANAVLLAQHNRVRAFDIVEEKIAVLNAGESPIDEEILREYLAEQPLDLTASSNMEWVLEEADYAVIATPTDYDEDTNQFDTSSVEQVLQKISVTNPKTTAVIKSTVPVGFTDEMTERFKKMTLLFSPEFLREGRALYDNLHPSRIIVSGDRTKSGEFADLLAQGAVDPGPILITGSAEAEAVKLFSNAYLALRVAFFNELDTLALEKNLDASQLVSGVSLDPRIGDYYNNPSFGYGGYCLPKDTKQLRANYQGVPQKLMSAVVESNETRMQFIAERIARLNPTTVGFYKLAMKSGSDNARSSSILQVIEQVKEFGIDVIVFDPTVKGGYFQDLLFQNDLAEFKELSDVIICNRWDIDLEDVRYKVYTRDLFGRD